jgi:predicted ATP-dependent serine protease
MLYISHMSKRFTKKQEDFTCKQCGYQVTGTGYTNHCPECLWSKHVDVNPGDRAEVCGAMMKPIDLYQKGQEWFVIHQCERCDFERRKKISADDNFDSVIELERAINNKKVRG